jgi:hypothetical protein
MASSTNGVGVTFTETYDRYGNRSPQTAVSGCVAPMTCPQPSVTISATTNRLVGPPYSYDSSVFSPITSFTRCPETFLTLRHARAGTPDVKNWNMQGRTVGLICPLAPRTESYDPTCTPHF